MQVDEFWMQMALSVAQSAAMRGEVPVGALIIKDGQVLCSAMNLRETLQDPTAHCEMLALKRAAELLGSWRLLDCDLYVSLEPCLMCAGALYQARLRRIVYAAPDPKGGALGSLYQIHKDQRLNHQLEVKSGVLELESRQILKDFFQKRRQENKTRS